MFNSATVRATASGDRAGHRKRMVNVGLAAQPRLTLMCFCGKPVGAVHVLDLRGVKTALQILAKIADHIIDYYRGGGFTCIWGYGVLVHRVEGERLATTLAIAPPGGARRLQRIARFELFVDVFDYQFRHFVQYLGGDFTLGYFAQRQYRGFVVLRFHHGVRTQVNLARPFGGRKDQLETIRYVVQTVLNRYS
jgi:hypothetical protein